MAEPVPDAAPAQLEIELKLLTDVRSARKVWSHKSVKALLRTAPRTRRIRTAYYDTPSDDLMHAGCAYRVRSCDGRFEQHLKSAGRVEGGLFHRQEWHAPLSSDAPKPALWSGEAAAFIAPFAGSLRRRFESDMQRTDALLSNGSLALELSVDVGVIRAFDETGAAVRESPLVEIELEWQAGPTEQVFDLALDLARSLPLRMGWQSKAERGYDLAGNRAPLPHRAMPATIPDDATLPQAAAQILGETMAHYLSNQPCLEASGAPEAVHQMRIACRRLRAALSLFREQLPPEETADFREGFRSLAQSLGTVRDIDVLLTETLIPLRTAAETPEDLREPLHNALTRLEVHRAESLAALRTLVATPETARLLLRLGRRVTLLTQRTDGEPVRPFADDDLGRRHRTVRHRGRHPAAQTATKRHRLRIAAKKLRYTAEFFQSLRPAKPMRAYLRTLSALQEILGRLNDCTNIPHLIARAVDDDEATATLAGYAMGWHLHRLRAALREASGLCRDLGKRPPGANRRK
jgi:inorganic triphosphatase YgiF